MLLACRQSRAPGLSLSSGTVGVKSFVDGGQRVAREGLAGSPAAS